MIKISPSILSADILKLEEARNNALSRGFISQKDQMINVTAKLKKNKES